MLGRWAAWLPHLGEEVVSHTLHVPVMGLGWGVSFFVDRLRPRDSADCGQRS